MGVVYRAFDPALQQERALKVLLAGSYGTPELVERFLREARALARLRHPGIVGVYDVGVDEERPFLVMELVSGGSLDGRTGMPVRESLALMDRIARAVDYAHGEGIVHRDLKPANVLLDGEGQPLITDFGLARDVAARDALTRSGQVMGTPAYMPPEQASGELDRMGPRSDVYSLGAMLYELVAGRRPFAGHDAIGLLNAILNKRPEPVRALRPEVPRDVETVIDVAMAKEPEDRYDSAAALAADIRRVLEDRPIHARRATGLARVGATIRRRPLVSAAVTLLALVAVAAGAFGILVRAELRRADAIVREARGLELARGDDPDDRREARALLLAATAEAPDRVTGWRGLARLALERDPPDLDEAAAAAARADALADDAEVKHILGRVHEARGAWSDAATSYQAALERGWRRDRIEVRLGRCQLRADRAAEAIVALEAVVVAGRPREERTEALALRAAAYDAVGAPASAEEDRWTLLALDPESPRGGVALAAIVEARVRALDAPGLVRLWEEVYRRLGDGTIQQVMDSDYERLLHAVDARAGDGSAIRAAIALALFARGGALERLRGVIGEADPERSPPAPLLVEAARASLRGRTVGGALDMLEAWAAAARGASLVDDGADGARQALTLLEAASELGDRDAATLRRIATGGGRLLRASVPIAVAVAATRHAGGAGDPDDSLSPATTAELLEASAADDDPLVAATAGAARSAIAILSDDDEPSTNAGARLALALTRIPVRPPPAALGAARRRRAAAAVRVAADAGGGEALADAAHLAIDSGSLEAARADVDAALAMGSAGAGARVLAPLLAALERRAGREPPADEPRRLAQLARRDPASAARADELVAFLETHDLLALPAANGMVRIQVPGDAERLDRAFEVVSPRPDQLRLSGGIAVEAALNVTSRFALSEVASVSVEIDPAPRVGVSVDARIDARVGRQWGYELDFHQRHGSDLMIDRARVGSAAAVGDVRRVGASLTRRRFDGHDDGVAVRRAVPVARLAPGDGRANIAVYDEGRPFVGTIRFELQGRLEHRAPAFVPAERRASVPAPGALPVIASGPHRPAPVPRDLAELRQGGASIACLGQWVHNDRKAHGVSVTTLREDVIVRATVTMPAGRANGSEAAGLALISEARPYDTVLLGIEANGSGAPTPYRVWVRSKRIHEWETTVAVFPWSDRSADLELERRRDGIVARFARPGEPAREMVAFAFPLDGPIEACLFGRSWGLERPDAPVPARFAGVEILVVPR